MNDKKYKNNKKNKNFILFWLSQSVSQLGSALTGYALIIWAYKQTGSAMAVSLMSFCSYLPYIIVSIFAGPFIDRNKKKTIMCVADTVAAVCSLGVLILLYQNRLFIWHIYIINGVVGFMNSFQSPATSVAIGLMVPPGMYEKASGMDSFSTNLITVSAPMLAAVILSVFGMKGVIFIDLITFIFAILILVFKIKIPEKTAEVSKKRITEEFKTGIDFLKLHKGIFYIMLTMAVINFFSRLTYENILGPMILARSKGSSIAFGTVSGILGIGGIAGGIMVAAGKLPKDKVKLIYFSSAFSFLFGDLLMGVGRNAAVWSVAGLAASIPIPFIMAGQRVIMYHSVPAEIQGRIFSVRNAVQFSTIPAGILLGGYLADYVFEPFMNSGNRAAAILGLLVGKGSGSGMAVMFLGTGILGFCVSLMGYYKKEIQSMKHEIKYESSRREPSLASKQRKK